MANLIRPAGIIFSYALLKLLAWKNFIPPLCEIITSVSERYGKYESDKHQPIPPSAP